MAKANKDDPFPTLPRRSLFGQTATVVAVKEPAPVSNISPPVSNTVSNKGDRVKAWRAKNPERYREQQRETMRKRRAAKRAG